MVANLTAQEKKLLDKAITNSREYIIEVDNDVIYVINTETNKVEGTLVLYGQDLILALLRYMGANAEFA